MGILALLLVVPALPALFHGAPRIVAPLEFTVEVAGPKGAPAVVPEAPADKPPEVPAPVNPVISTQPVTDAGSKRTIEKGKKIKRVVEDTKKPSKAAGGGGLKTTLSPEEIKRRMEMGAVMSDHTSAIPDEEPRCLGIVERTLKDAWLQPSLQDAGNVAAVPEVTIRLGDDGKILSRRMTKKSGSAVYDDSVMQAVNSVERIPYLTPAFLAKFKEIAVTFELDPNEGR